MEERREVIGASVKRVDAFDKVTGYAKYTDDLCDKGAYIAKILHSTVANGRVTSIDADEARKIPGVIKVVTCFDVPKNLFSLPQATPGLRRKAIRTWRTA